MSEPGKVALITGSGRRRIGWHVAAALAGRGYRLALHYNRSEAEARESVAHFDALGTETAAFQADLADEVAVQRVVDGVLQRFGRIDVLVNAAAIWQRKRLEDITAADVRAHFDANALAAFLCCQKVGLQMVEQSSGGSIVTLADWAEARPYLHYAAYFPSKGAVTAMTRCLAVELGTRNPRVRVNCIMPGPAMLPDDLSAAERELAIQGTLVKREGRPENIAQAVLHFVENDFLTGVCLPVDGGRTVYSSAAERG